MEFYTRHWPTPDEVRDTIDVLTQSACPTSEAGIIDFLAARGFHVAAESRAVEGERVGYDFDAPRAHLTGQCYIDGGGSLAVVATFGGHARRGGKPL